MNKTFTSLFGLTVVYLTSFGQSIQSYQRALDLGGEDYINQVASGNVADAYVIGSSDAVGTAGGYDMFLANFDPNDGTINWAKQYGTLETEFGTRILNDGSGNLVLVGRSNAFSANATNDLVIAQVDATTGAVNWSKAVGTDTIDVPFAVKSSNDGGYIIGGYTQPGQRSSMYLIKMQADGTVDWTRTIGSQFGNERLYDIKALGSGEGYLLIGYTGIYGSVLNEAMFILVDDAGDLQAAFTFGGTGDDDARKFADASDGFFIAGNTRSYGVGVQDIFLAKFTFNQITELPELAWLKTYGGAQSEDFTDLTVISEDGLVLLMGHTNSFGSGGDALLVAVSEADGSVLLSYTYGGSGDDWLSSFLGTEAGLVLAGYSVSFGSGTDAYLVKLGDEAESGCNEEIQTLSAVDQTSNVTVIGPPTNSADFTSVVTTADVDQSIGFSVYDMSVTDNELCLTTGIQYDNDASELGVYPIPTVGPLNITVELGTNMNASLEIVSADGRVVVSRPMDSNRVLVDCSSLCSGVYLVKVQSENSVWSKPFVKQ